MSPSKPVTVVDVVRENIRLRHYSLRTEKSYIGWVWRYKGDARLSGSGRSRQAATGQVLPPTTSVQ
jgi:hypothetical protein